jgi:hypothetical protein
LRCNQAAQKVEEVQARTMDGIVVVGPFAAKAPALIVKDLVEAATRLWGQGAAG